MLFHFITHALIEGKVMLNEIKARLETLNKTLEKVRGYL